MLTAFRGAMSVPDVTAAAKDIACAIPNLHFGELFDGLKEVGPLLATAIPLGVYNFTEGMDNARVAAVGVVLSFIGLIHAPEVGWNMNGPVALGYLFVAVVCGAFAATRPEPRVPDAEEVELDRVHGG
ncbi:hypothetical protein [Cryptosporangium sp. NPDC048952]|uniref:hypothetical protein n=1 Tax=Cryptosporangium sp. NPDC048952 TaxID=3363961 RepID=UPI0037246E0A